MYFFFNDTATTEIYTLSLHDALPISVEVVADADDAVVRHCEEGATQDIEMGGRGCVGICCGTQRGITLLLAECAGEDRKSTRLNSSHANISYAVFCLKKKNQHILEKT